MYPFGAFALLLVPQPALAKDLWFYSEFVTHCAAQGDDAAQVCLNTDPEQNQTIFGVMSCVLGERDAWDVLLTAEYQTVRGFAKSMDEKDQEFFSEYATGDDRVLAAQSVMEMTATQIIAPRDYQDTI